jgi:hypothetical protein
VSNENFRRELGHVFDDMSGSPSPALADRVRSSVARAPEQHGPYWIAGIAAAVMAVVVIGILFVGNPLHHQANTLGPAAGSSPSPTASAGPTPSASPAATPDSSLPAFQCTSSAQHYDWAQAPAQAVIGDLRTGTHPGYDRLTIELKSGGLTDVQLQTQAGTVFTRSPRGDQVTLAGRNGILLIIRGADLHTGYTGSTDLKTGYATLVEVRQLEDFEGVVQLGLGVSGATCYRAFVLTNPSRLVIDIRAA